MKLVTSCGIPSPPSTWDHFLLAHKLIVHQVIFIPLPQSFLKLWLLLHLPESHIGRRPRCLPFLFRSVFQVIVRLFFFSRLALLFHHLSGTFQRSSLYKNNVWCSAGLFWGLEGIRLWALFSRLLCSDSLGPVPGLFLMLGGLRLTVAVTTPPTHAVKSYLNPTFFKKLCLTFHTMYCGFFSWSLLLESF